MNLVSQSGHPGFFLNGFLYGGELGLIRRKILEVEVGTESAGSLVLEDEKILHPLGVLGFRLGKC